MPERTIDPAQLASYTAHLRREERSPGTIEKYLRDIRAFAGWLDGRPVSRELAAEWRDHLLSKDYAPVTINSMLAALNGPTRLSFPKNTATKMRCSHASTPYPDQCNDRCMNA